MRTFQHVEQRRTGFGWRGNSASACRGKTKFRRDAHHDLCLAVSDRQIGRLDRQAGRRFDHRAVLLDRRHRFSPQGIGAAVRGNPFGTRLSPMSPGRTTNGLAEEAVSCEPVSAAGFPANREKYREFLEFREDSAELIPHSSPKSMTYNKIPYESEQGFSSRRTGNLAAISRKFAQRLAMCRLPLRLA